MLRNLKEFKLPEIEEKVLKFWKENQIFEKSLKLREGGKKYRFFEGPPTANGRPGIHHIESRAFKDVIPRFKTMCGYFVRRKAGWDTQGLPVEIEVEKELGLKNKQEIEKFGIAEFNERAKASVWKYLDDWEKLTDRIGFWLNLKEAYITYKPQYIESLWWVFKQIEKRGLLKQSFKIIPFCPRCQTPLSSHEMGQPGVYKKVKDPSVYVKFRIKEPKSSKLKAKSYLLVWTTTPWTLPSNVAIAVNPNLSYTKYKVGDEFIWSYNVPPVDIAGYDKIEVVEKVSGKKLAGTEYEPLFKVKGPWLKNKKFFRVYEADFVGTEDGTGLVHIAPAFGEDDMNLVKKFQKDLVGEIPITIDERGIVQGGLPGAGKFVKQADKEIIEFLVKDGSMLKHGEIEHEYPFCWRCSTPILYYARFSWFIEMSKLSNELLKNNEKINWVPEYIKDGRFGNWLKEVKDWAISRDRYWGTPLPIWQCQTGKSEIRNPKSEKSNGCGNIEVVGSLEDLDEKRYSKNNFFLLRHGEADHVLLDLVASGPETGKNISHLTEKGILQIEKSSEKLAKILKGKKLAAIYASPYSRTVESAKIIAKKNKAKIITDKRLSEINGGIFNWKKISDYGKFWSNHLEKFTKAPPEGENLNELKKRMMEAILDINSKHENENILIVSHGDPLWILEGAVSGLANEEMLKAKYMEIAELKELELHNWPYNSDGEVDIHRPYIDNIYLACKKCFTSSDLAKRDKGKMKRVSEVADCWFDSGAMPFAQDHYPFDCERAQNDADSNAEKRGKNISVNPRGYLDESALRSCTDFPADYISEAIDQTRGWFYTLLAISTALGIEIPPYKNVICLGMVLDKKGQKMSKSKGNVVSPWDMINKYGADIIRWYFYTINQPGDPKQFDEADLGKMLRKFIMIIYNSFVFYDTYAHKVTSDPRTEADLGAGHGKRQATSNNILDRWILSKLNKVVNTVTENLEKYDIVGAGKILEEFVDDLSRWYIRRSRTRLQRSDDKNDFEAASQTLYYCLLQLSKLLAPFTPFFADALFMSLNNESGMMNDGEKKLHDSKFIIRNSVHLQDWPKPEKTEVDFQLLDKMDEVRKISSLALALRAEKGLKVRQPLGLLEIKSKKIDRGDVELLDILKDEVNVKEVKWNFEMQEEVSLDVEITPELREEGIIREVMRMVQGLRHDANYVPKDVIVLLIDVLDPIRSILDRHSAELKRVVGAMGIEFGKSDKFDAEISSKIDNEQIWIAVRRL